MSAPDPHYPAIARWAVHHLHTLSAETEPQKTRLEVFRAIEQRRFLFNNLAGFQEFYTALAITCGVPPQGLPSLIIQPETPAKLA